MSSDNQSYVNVTNKGCSRKDYVNVVIFEVSEICEHRPACLCTLKTPEIAYETYTEQDLREVFRFKLPETTAQAYGIQDENNELGLTPMPEPAQDAVFSSLRVVNVEGVLKLQYIYKFVRSPKNARG